MEPQAPFLYQPAATARIEALRAIVRRALSQPGVTSDALLILADAMAELENSAEAKRLAEQLRALAPIFATGAPSPTLRPTQTDPARALLRRYPVRAARLRRVFEGLPVPNTPQELGLVLALTKAAEIEEGHSP